VICHPPNFTLPWLAVWNRLEIANQGRVKFFERQITDNWIVLCNGEIARCVAVIEVDYVQDVRSHILLYRSRSKHSVEGRSRIQLQFLTSTGSTRVALVDSTGVLVRVRPLIFVGNWKCSFLEYSFHIEISLWSIWKENYGEFGESTSWVCNEQWSSKVQQLPSLCKISFITQKVSWRIHTNTWLQFSMSQITQNMDSDAVELVSPPSIYHDWSLILYLPYFLLGKISAGLFTRVTLCWSNEIMGI
jgi:hypothetical protein